jgi:hypothetical protein
MLPSLGGSAGGARQNSSKPPGLPLAASSLGLGGGRTGNRNAKENKNTAVITIDDLQRLRESCGIGGSKSSLQIEKEIEQEDRKVLMERSRARTKNWPNTIENMRNKRIEDRYRQLEEAEVCNTNIFNLTL